MMDRYRLGTLQWVPLDLSRYKQVVSWMHGLFQGFAIRPLQRIFSDQRIVSYWQVWGPDCGWHVFRLHRV